MAEWSQILEDTHSGASNIFESTVCQQTHPARVRLSKVTEEKHK